MCKLKGLKIDFFIRLSNFIIKEKTITFNDNILKKNEIEEYLITEIIKCNDFNILVDITCNFLNSKYNLNIESDFYRLMKN